MALETILLAVGPGDADRIENLAQAVVDVAKPTGATVVVAHVFTRDEFDDVIDRLDYDPEGEISADEVAARHATVRELTDHFVDAGVTYQVRGAVGAHGETIVDLANEVGADRVVVGGRTRSPTGKAVFGSTAQEVMLSSPCPVTFVRSD
ncbi:universal stress protein [Halorussus amylolyticus]|uniref:universal stress protein n=1 Tax=Halorussus amylolyticus TaxID=1126242 RepID=UPI00104672CC|nr:universal stress protein [Halorussus amylolyticus]